MSSSLQIKLFADGADLASMLKLYNNLQIKGFTTNPTLMKKAGVSDYKEFAQEVLSYIKHKPISFEVFADDFEEMYCQAKEISSWADNVYVKIPITNTNADSSSLLIDRLSKEGVKLNVTGIFTLEQTIYAAYALKDGAPSIISIFAGRIADTGRDPVPIMQAALALCNSISTDIELLWASPRELYNIVQADKIGCHIITASPDILSKLDLLNKDLTEFSLDTVKMFYNDANKAGYFI
jgi:transaldolase